MDSKSGSQAKSIKRRKSGKGKKDMEGNYVTNKNRNLKEKDWENQTSAHTSQKVSNIHGKKSDIVEPLKTPKEGKVTTVLPKTKLEDKTVEKIKKWDDALDTKSKKTFNLSDDFKDAIEKRNDEAEAGYSLSKNMKYARMKKKTNEKIQDSWNRSFMKSTASFMVKEEMKQDQLSSEKNDSKEDSKESLDNINVECNKNENIITDEIIIGNESTNICGVLNSDKNASDIVDTPEENTQVSKQIESIKNNNENIKEVNKEKKDQNTSTEKSSDSKDYTTQTKFPPYRSRFVNDSEGIKKFIKDNSKTNNPTKQATEGSHQKQESSISSIDITNEIVEPLVMIQSPETIDEEERPVKFFISDDESDSDTAIFVDAEQPEPQDQDISDADEKVVESDIKSEKEPLSDQIIENDGITELETPNILEKRDMSNYDSCLPINKETCKNNSSVYIDMIEDNSETISDKDSLENSETDKNNVPNISNFECGASAIDQIFHDLTSDQKDKEDIMVETHIRKEKEENLICFPWAGEETQDNQLGQVLKITSKENQGKKCESDPEGVDFAEPKSSEDKEKPSKTDQPSRTISGFGRSYRNFQRFEGLTSSNTQEKCQPTGITGDETSLSMGKREDSPGQDNVVCGTMSDDTDKMKDTTQIVDTMSFLGITNKEDAPNISTSLEKMEGELEMKTEKYIQKKYNELPSNLQANTKSKNPFHPENQNSKILNEPLPFATAFETLASIKKSLLEAQEYPFQNKLNELSGYTKMKSDDDINVSRDCNSENIQKTAFNNSTKSTAGIGDKIKEMLGLGNINEENSTPNSKTIKSNTVHSIHTDVSNNPNIGEQSQNSFNQVNPNNNDKGDRNSESNTQIEAVENITQSSNSTLKETEGAVSKAEIVLKSGKNVFNICDPRKMTFTGINKKYKVDINPHENQSNRPVNQKDGKSIKPLKKYSSRSLSQPVPVQTESYEIISESDILPQTEFTGECRNNKFKSKKSSLRRTMSQEESEETPIQTTHPSKCPPKKVTEKILNNMESHRELYKELSDSLAGDLEKSKKLVDGDSKLIDLESCEDTSLITWSTESPVIDHCKSSEYDSYTKYFKKFTHTKSEKFVHTLTDTTYEPLEDENLKISGTINKGVWNQNKFDELNIKKNTSHQDRSNEDFSSILIFDDLCPDKWKEQCNVDVNVDKQNGSGSKLGNSTGMKKEPFQQSIVSENTDNKADPLNSEKQCQSTIKKHKVSWLLNNDPDIGYSESTTTAKQSATAAVHSKPKRLQSPPPKLPAAIEISDADFDSAIMSPTSPDFKASGSLNTLLSKLSNADICMDKKYNPLSKITDHLQSVQQSKIPPFTSTIKLSDSNNSPKDKEPQLYFKRPELVSTTIADWKVSSPVFEALNILNPPPTKNPSNAINLKDHTAFMDSLEGKVSSDETTENILTSMLSFTEKLSSTTETNNPSALTFTEKNSAPSPENKLSSFLFSVREKRTPVTPIQSPTGFKGSLGIPTLPPEDLSFSDILEDNKFKLEGVKSTKI